MKQTLDEIVKRVVDSLHQGGYSSRQFLQRYKLILGSPECLSDREKEVLIGMAHGKTAKEIAKTLGIETVTAQAYRTSMGRKLGLHNIAQVVQYAIRHRLIDVNPVDDFEERPAWQRMRQRRRKPPERRGPGLSAST